VLCGIEEGVIAPKHSIVYEDVP